jgi:MarR family transcriptional regulator, organic hydroperoxide resistance regulator
MASVEEFSTVLQEWIRVYMRRTGQDFKKFMGDSGLSFSQVNTLMRLHFTGEADVTDIAEQLGVSNAAASQLVDRLVRMMLIERKEDKADRRIKCLVLTQAGHEMAERLVNIRRGWMEKFTNSLTADQRDNISSALQTLTDAARGLED